MQIINWFSMGGYSFYIWSAYGLVFSMLMAQAVLIKRQKNRINQKLIHWFKR